jgi:hypothetical protein
MKDLIVNFFFFSCIYILQCRQAKTNPISAVTFLGCNELPIFIFELKDSSLNTNFVSFDWTIRNLSIICVDVNHSCIIVVQL